MSMTRLAVILIALGVSSAALAKDSGHPSSVDAALKFAWTQFGNEVQPANQKPSAGDYDLGLVRDDGRLRWFYYCTRFVRMAYRQDGNWATAAILRTAATDGIVEDRAPTRGALVFWKWVNKRGVDVGHVGIHVSSGKVIHTGTNAEGKSRGVVVESIDHISNELGGPAAYVGWIDPTSAPLAWRVPGAGAAGSDPESGDADAGEPVAPAPKKPPPASSNAEPTTEGTYRVDIARSVKAYLEEEYPGFDSDNGANNMVVAMAHQAYKPGRTVVVRLFGGGTCELIGFGDRPTDRTLGRWSRSGDLVTFRGIRGSARFEGERLHMRVWAYTGGPVSGTHWNPIHVTATSAESSMPVVLVRRGEAGQSPAPGEPPKPKEPSEPKEPAKPASTGGSTASEPPAGDGALEAARKVVRERFQAVARPLAHHHAAFFPEEHVIDAGELDLWRVVMGELETYHGPVHSYRVDRKRSSWATRSVITKPQSSRPWYPPGYPRGGAHARRWYAVALARVDDSRTLIRVVAVSISTNGNPNDRRTRWLITAADVAAAKSSPSTFVKSIRYRLSKR